MSYINLLKPQLPKSAKDKIHWGRLYGSADALAISTALRTSQQLVLLITEDTPSAVRLESALRFYAGDNSEQPIIHFPDWETLPYDQFSPHQDIISERLLTLSRLPSLKKGILIVPVSTLLHRLPAQTYLKGNTLAIQVGDTMILQEFRRDLDACSYRCVTQVVEHGEFALRGSVLDIFPMGSKLPYRIDLFDDEIETIRTFDPENQRSIDKVEKVQLLPAKEFPFTTEAIEDFRERYRQQFTGDPEKSLIYQDVSNGLAPAGIEYYMPLFFDETSTLFDYLPDNTLVCIDHAVHQASETFCKEIAERFEQRCHDVEHPILPPGKIFLQTEELFAKLNKHPLIEIQTFEHQTASGKFNYASNKPLVLAFDVRSQQPAKALLNFISEFKGRILFAAESAGRREALLELLKGYEIRPHICADWQEFMDADERICITIAPLENGLLLDSPEIAVIAEPQLFGQQVMQRRRRKRSSHDAENAVHDLAELQVGSPVVHIDHGVGRYLGLKKIAAGGQESEFLFLEYARDDKLYVPVSSLHLISRYSGSDPDHAPLHRLGNPQWEKAKSKAKEKIRDVAAELLAIYARREAREGFKYEYDESQYSTFSAQFPFEETPDQEQAILDVMNDMTSRKPMDRLICGDVGFGKTEVAMRAAFLATQAGKQIAILVPTTLLAQQHFETFKDRFADWPVRVESLSRFRSKKETNIAIAGLEDGTVDIVIGTHKLLQGNIDFKRLGLLIIDEEHRFGVRQKEMFKSMRSEVDILTLTATPIPRTLNMSMSGMRDLSIIATPPARRLSVKTFISQWNNGTVKEACLREIKRGGQVYLLHNKVDTIDKVARELAELVPEAKVQVAHGQMRERELESIMSDFYHQRFNILVCTTIIETGIDIPTANTIIIDRADNFGLAQLYQLRGRVGRSHHRAYAYLMVPPKRSMTADAKKRLEAIESIKELGTGFTLATQDLEIRGAGELLGEDQSGQMQELGFSMYMDMLDRAVKDLKEGREPNLDRPLDHGTEVDIGSPTLIPEDYLPDINNRLMMYKRIANAKDLNSLRELQVEMIDRFGLLPDQLKNLFSITRIKLKATPLGIQKIEMGPAGGRISFSEKPNIEPMKIIQLIQQQAQRYQLDPKQRLKIIQPLEEVETRIEALDKLLTKLAA